jgi:hypothetical protein
MCIWKYDGEYLRLVLCLCYSSRNDGMQKIGIGNKMAKNQELSIGYRSNLNSNILIMQ